MTRRRRRVDERLLSIALPATTGVVVVAEAEIMVAPLGIKSAYPFRPVPLRKGAGPVIDSLRRRAR
jgi:hypothetical protein